MTLPESPLERAKRLSRGLVDLDALVGITERVPFAPAQVGRSGEASETRSGSTEDEHAVLSEAKDAPKGIQP